MRPLVLLLLVAAAPAFAQLGSVVPVDEAAQDPSFITFRAQLLEAVQARDTAFVLAHLAPNATLSFGGDSGAEGFRRLWLRGDRPAGQSLWAVLTRTVALGSTYDPDPDYTTAEAVATVPYVFDAPDWPVEADAFEYAAVVGEKVRVRSAPSLEAETIASLTYTAVRAPWSTDVPEGWRKVGLEDGRTGYVAARFLRSPIDHRIRFEKRGGRWTIAAFVAGD